MARRLLTTLVAAATLVASSAAAKVDYRAAIPAAVPDALVARDALLPRQTGSSSDAPTDCFAAAISIMSSAPTPPPELRSQMEAEISRNPRPDLCSLSTPASLSSLFASYDSAVDAWSSSNAPQLAACSQLSTVDALAACPTRAFVKADVSSAAARHAPTHHPAAAAAVAAVGLAVALL